MSGTKRPTDDEAPRRPGSFPATSWTLVSSLGEGQGRVRADAWERFFTSYSRPLCVWLVGRGTAWPEAEDIVQELFAKLAGDGGFNGSPEAGRGRLRSYLLACARNSLVDRLRHQSRKRRGGGAQHFEIREGDASQDADDVAFDRGWAEAVIARACETLRAEYRERGSARLFDLILPLLDGDEHNSAARGRAREQLELGENTFNVAAKRLRERLAARLRDEVTATLSEPAEGDVEAELLHLLRAFESGGGLGAMLSKDDSSTDGVTLE